MKMLRLGLLLMAMSFVSHGQAAEIVVFRHDLRWVDETNFPNYFLIEDIKDSIFEATRDELTKYLNIAEIKFPENVSYEILNGFGNQKIRMPISIPENDFEVGIFSFITRATVGSSVNWKINLIIKQKGEVTLEKEIVHELEYFNVSGYLTAKSWLTPKEFKDIFVRLLKESLGVVPPSEKVIVVGSLDQQEEKARAHFAEPVRHLFKIDGNWRGAGNFEARLASQDDTVMNLRFKEELSWEFPKPSLADFVAQLISQTIGMEVVYDELVDYEKKMSLVFSDGNELGITLKWIEIEIRSTAGEEIVSQPISDPLVAELYSQNEQVGYFFYAQREVVHATDKTQSSFNIFNGLQTKNTLGIERIHRIEGVLHETPIVAEYNESEGNIQVKSGNKMLGVMVVENTNPDNRSISNLSLSKNKKFVYSYSTIGQPSLKNAKSAEWFPVYLPKGFSDESGKMCIETLIFLFFGIGNM